MDGDHGARRARRTARGREKGVDAIVAAAPVLARLGELDAALGASARIRCSGRGSVHASLIAGGEELSTYPARCVLSLERRTLPGEDGVRPRSRR